MNVVISLKKKLFSVFPIQITENIFPKCKSCIDIVSFDVGTVNLACVKTRFCADNKSCCVVNCVLMDIKHPEESLSADKHHECGDKRKKPEYVEPFPSNPLSEKKIIISEFHKKFLQVSENKSETYEDDILRLPFALEMIEWAYDSDVDHVIIEIQKRDNILMRIVGYSIMTFYQTQRWIRIKNSIPELKSLSENAKITMFPSTLKLSAEILTILSQSWNLVLTGETGTPYVEDKVQKEKVQEKIEIEEVEILNEKAFLKKSSHSQRKTTSILVVANLFKSCHVTQRTHPFRHWLETQRREKNNICDALLQSFAWIVKNEQEPRMQKIKKKKE